MAIFEKKSNSFYKIDNTDRIAVHMNDIEIKNRYHRLNDCCSLDDTKLEIIKCARVAYICFAAREISSFVTQLEIMACVGFCVDWIEERKINST